MLPHRTLAVLLLTLHGSEAGDAEPLTATEWTRLAGWLVERDLAPESLVGPDADAVLAVWVDPAIGRDRLRFLLARRHAIQPRLERWAASGMWFLLRSDPGYPTLLKLRLKGSAPPVLCGYGNPRLFGTPGLALVGSRDATNADIALASGLAKLAAAAGSSVVSGGARGIDTAAEQAAFAAGGTVISILADALVKVVRKPGNRERIEDGSLALVTPYSPEAGFSSGNAMGRNRLIYALADAAVAVCSTLGKGGTFSGARTVLQQAPRPGGWEVPVWTPRSNDPASGNNALIDLGARELPPLGSFTIEDLVAPVAVTAVAHQATLGFSAPLKTNR